MNTVIGISGISGSGKSTLTKALSSDLNATALYWDDFDAISTAPSDYLAWYESGQNYKVWDYAELAHAIDKLKVNNRIQHPSLQIDLKPSKHIIVDAPLGKLHSQTARHIDIFIHLDTPLDIALSRRILRDFNDSNNSCDILAYIDDYLNHS